MNRKIITVIKITVSLGLMYWIYSRIPISGLKEIFSRVRLELLPIIYLILLFNTYISSLKWHLLLKADSVRMPVFGLMKKYLIATFFNIFLPSNIGGDAYRMYSVSKSNNKFATSVVSVISDRLSGFLALVMLSLIAALAIFFKIGNKETLFITLSVFCLLITVIFFFFYQKPILYLVNILRLDRFPKIHEFVQRFLAVFDVYRKNRFLLAQVMGISLVFQFSAIVCVRLMAQSIEVSTPLIYFVAFVPLITLIEALPVSIYGIGVRDLSYVYFFSKVGMTDFQTRALALLYLGLTLIYSLVGGVLFCHDSWIMKNPTESYSNRPSSRS
jgi:glycosyltransferase 2 family protein